MFRKWSIAWRLSVSVLLASVLILSAVIGYGYIIASQILEQELEAKARQMARATTGRIELVEVAARKIVDGMDGRLENYPPTDKEVLFSLLERLVRDNEEIYGATVALEPGAFGYSKDYTAPYVYRSWNHLVRDDRGKHATPYFVQDWYAIPQLMQRPVWIEPYRAEGRGDVGEGGGGQPAFDLLGLDEDLQQLGGLVAVTQQDVVQGGDDRRREHTHDDLRRKLGMRPLCPRGRGKSCAGSENQAGFSAG